MNSSRDELIRSILDPHGGPALSPHASNRRDEILGDLLARAPGIRRARAARRVAIAGSPILVLALLLIIIAGRPLRTPAASADSPLVHAPEPTHVPVVVPSSDASPVGIAQVAPDPSTSPTFKVRIVSTAGADHSAMIAGARASSNPASITRTIDDTELVDLLAAIGSPDGIVRIQGRTLLASDVGPAPNPDPGDRPRSHAPHAPPTPHAAAL